MQMLKTYKYICVALVSICSVMPAAAEHYAMSDTLSSSTTTPKRYTSREEARKALQEDHHSTFFTGFSVGVDLVGPIMDAASSRGSVEGMCRAHLLETFFPRVRNRCRYLQSYGRKYQFEFFYQVSLFPCRV